MEDTPRTFRLSGVGSGFTWAHFCGLVLLTSGLAMVAATLAESAMATPLSITFGLSMVSMSILEVASRK